MTLMQNNNPSRSIGIRRREVLQVGSSGLLGIGLSGLLRSHSLSAEASRSVATPVKKGKSLIIVFLTGACSHHDTFDMKPDAPPEIRGEFKTISTSVAGLHVCEHLPQLAARANQYAVIRSLSHGDNNHLMSTHMLLTGHLQPGGFFDKVALRDDWPCYSAALDHLRPRHDPIPSGVNLPTFLMSSPLTWPGQHAGLLGPKHDPWQITADPNLPEFRVDALHLAEGIDVDRFQNRKSLLDQINRKQSQLSHAAEHRRLSDQQDMAFSLLTSSRLTQAFEINRESDAVRDRYGRHTLGQSLLLAKRLTEVGVPVVQVNVGRVQTWDNHSNIFPTLKNRLLPPVDQGVAALLDDLHASGQIDNTMVMMLGEFGRTPKINGGGKSNSPGRDHWGPCFSGLFAGAGVRGGQVIGKSDDIGAYPITKRYSPDDVGATVYHVLGVDPASEIHDRFNRPLRLNNGALIDPLFSGAAS